MLTHTILLPHVFQAQKAIIAMNSLMVIMSVVELVVTIWSSVLCCGAVCRCCKTSSYTQRVVQYNAVPAVYPQQQMAMYPASTSVAIYHQGQQHPLPEQKFECK